MARTQNEWRRFRLADILFLATTASAQTLVALRSSALSLANFQVIASNAVPRNCIAAYNQPMTSCSMADFNNGPCSNNCVQELGAMQSMVQSACHGVQISANTILGQTMTGNLVPLLCPNGGEGEKTTTMTLRQTMTATTRVRTSIVQPSLTSTIGSQPTTTSTSTPVAAETSQDPNSPSIQTTPLAVPTTTQTSARTSSTQTAQQEFHPGGSPFDVPPDEKLASAARPSAGWSVFLALAVSLGVIMLR
jgi:hypothetical protein